jgi:hypothetical protein
MPQRCPLPGSGQQQGAARDTATGGSDGGLRIIRHLSRAGLAQQLHTRLVQEAITV